MMKMVKSSHNLNNNQMKKLKLILSTIVFLFAISGASASIVVMGGASSVDTDGTTTHIICGCDPGAVCCVVSQTAPSEYWIEPTKSDGFAAVSYTIRDNHKDPAVIEATNKK